jgi:hypothetical protein
MDRWAYDQLEPWLEIRRELPIGALLCVIRGATAGRSWEASAAAVEMAHEGVLLVVIQRQLGHANLAIISVYLQGIDSSEIISTVHGRPSPTISATAGLQLRR